MNPFAKIFSKKIEQKSNPVGSVMITPDVYRSSFGRLEDYISQAYERNPTVAECVNMIASGAAEPIIRLKRQLPDGTCEEITNHPVLDLIDRPNPTQTRNEFFQQFFASRLVLGNAFMVADQINDRAAPVELWNLNALAMSIMPSVTGVPKSYRFRGVSGDKEFAVNNITGAGQVYHSRNLNLGLTDALWGVSPLISGRAWIDVSNEGAEWNASLLQNNAKPSGILKKTGAAMTAQQYQQIKDRFEQDYQGARNSGVPMILDNGLEWQEMSINPKDMDFQASLNFSDKKICGIYRIPYVLLSPDASTFNNVENARRILWEDIIAPFLNNFLDSFDNWLLPKYKDTQGMFFEADYSSIPAFQIKEAQQADRVQALLEKGVITRNEARKMLGFDDLDIPEANEIYIQSSLIPLSAGDISMADVALSETDKFNNRGEDGNAGAASDSEAEDSGEPVEKARKAVNKKARAGNKKIL